MGNVIILGSQWGDEGKGKIVDLFAERFDIVARYQGGHNAGHTVFIGEKKFILKLVPSGILRPGKQAVIGNGLVIDPAALLSEIEALESAGVAVAANLFISNRAHVLFPAHRMMEKMSEGREGRVSIGTTSRPETSRRGGSLVVQPAAGSSRPLIRSSRSEARSSRWWRDSGPSTSDSTMSDSRTAALKVAHPSSVSVISTRVRLTGSVARAIRLRWAIRSRRWVIEDGATELASAS